MQHIKLFSPIDLSGHDHKVLTLLYRPLIGTIAFSLYQFIFSYTYHKESVDIEESIILNMLVITKKDFDEACNFLSAYALLDVFERQEDILLQLKKPMTATSDGHCKLDKPLMACPEVHPPA